jgi:predicted nucleic acid-binding protein
MGTVRTFLIDASALVKLLVHEPDSDAFRKYFSQHSVFVTTSLCIGEVLGVLKAKWLRKQITQEEYFRTSEESMAHLRDGSITIEDVSPADRAVFEATERVARDHALDIVDAHQLVTLERGFYGTLGGESRAELLTADSALAKAARERNLRVQLFPTGNQRWPHRLLQFLRVGSFRFFRAR